MGRKKNEINLKEPVRIREKNLKDGNRSLYLDIYLNGARKKEGLKLYLVPEVNASAKLQNKNTWQLAEQIKAQRILDIQKVGMVDWEKVRKIHITLLDYVDQHIADTAGLSESSIQGRQSLRVRIKEHLHNINKVELPLCKVDREYCKDFIAFLKTCTYNKGKKKLSATTQRHYVDYFCSIMEKALREGLVNQNPFKLLEKKDKPQKDSAEREFLTIEELRKAMCTDCRYPIVKNMFLFSCFTGLRYSDVVTLEWNHIHQSPDGKSLYIEKNQVKTGNSVIVPLSNEALRWMPDREEGEELVFHGFHATTTTVENLVGEWMRDAGITKHITYHSSRHTAATTWLTLGANLYVVSKLLGHSSIRVTEVYAKIVDEKKIEATNLVNSIFA